MIEIAKYYKEQTYIKLKSTLALRIEREEKIKRISSYFKVKPTDEQLEFILNDEKRLITNNFLSRQTGSSYAIYMKTFRIAKENNHKRILVLRKWHLELNTFFIGNIVTDIERDYIIFRRNRLIIDNNQITMGTLKQVKDGQFLGNMYDYILIDDVYYRELGEVIELVEPYILKTNGSLEIIMKE